MYDFLQCFIALKKNNKSRRNEIYRLLNIVTWLRSEKIGLLWAFYRIEYNIF